MLLLFISGIGFGIGLIMCLVFALESKTKLLMTSVTFSAVMAYLVYMASGTL